MYQGLACCSPRESNTYCMGAQQRLIEQINAFGELAAILVKVKSLEKATLTEGF